MTLLQERQRRARHTRRARLRANGGKRTARQWRDLCAFYDYKCLRCHSSRHTLTADHIIPICKGGSDDISNVQPLCFHCNSIKGSLIVDYRKGMNKKEAAAFLGVSERAIERYTHDGRISTRYEKGKTRPIAVYAEEELRQLKKELDNPAIVRPSLETPAPDVMPTNPDQALTPFVGFSQAEPRSLARLSDVTPEQFAEILTRAYAAGASEIAQRLPPMLPPASDAAGREYVTISDLAHKLLLSLPEAARLSGVPIDKLRAAVNSGELAAVSGVGRGLGKVRRETLETYVKSLEKKRRKT